MHTPPDRPDGLTDLERRLAACAPSADGLDADAMLFAAGRASARPGRARLVWPGVVACLSAMSFVLGARLATERAERQQLAHQPEQPAPLLPPSVAPEPPTAEQPPNSSVLAARPALEQGLDAWPPAKVPAGAPAPEPPVLRVGRPDSLPDL